MNQGIQPRRASEWLTALLERPEDEVLRRRFDAWLAADPAHAADWAEIARTYEAIGKVPPRHRDQWTGWAAASGAPRRLPQAWPLPVGAHGATRDRGGNPASWRRRMAIGLGAAAACLALLLVPGLERRLAADHVTATAEIRSVRLADGSTVRLGPRSALDVAYDGDARSVRLLQGEAFFEVAPDPARPFRVEASLLDVTVLGTAFEVRVDDGGADVAVRRGTVRVDAHAGAPAAPERLEAGEWMSLAPGGMATRGVQPPAQVAAWLQGRLIVRDRPVGEVVDDLRPYFSGIVILRGDSLPQQPLTGVYDLSDPLAALKAVAAAQGATAYQLSPWVLVISEG